MNLKKFEAHCGPAICRLIVNCPKGNQVLMQGLLAGSIKLFESCFGGSKVRSEQIHGLLRPERHFKKHRATSRLDLRLATEALCDHGFVTQRIAGTIPGGGAT